MDFRILGPLEVWDRGRPIELRRRKPRALLAMLLLHAGEAVSSDALIDALWAEDAPRTARAALQNYVAQLRRELGPGLVGSTPGGYMLEASAEQIDLGRFERLVAEGRQADGDERVERLREALELWRGPPLADLLFEPFAPPEASRLEELRTAAVEDLIDAELARGAGPDLVAELETLIAEHPFRERFRGQLMLALYRSGRQAEALEAYQETRRALVDELGIEPSAALRGLEQAILRQDPALESPATGRTEAPPGEERRKTVTILFADLAYPGAVDPEHVHELSTRALACVRAVLEDHGAAIEQRAGDELMAVFGIPRAHEDDPHRAARSALELRTEVAALATTFEQEGRGGIELRVGIETGEVLAGVDEAGHGFTAGPAIALAKRIVQLARPGETLAGPGTLRLLGDAVVVERAQNAGDEAAGIVELVEGTTALPRHLEAPLVNRHPELQALHRSFTSTVEERSCRMHLVLGEAGIGKTRLARELSVQLDGSANVLVGHCASYGKGATYVPLVEILRQVGAQRELGELLTGDEHAEAISARLADLAGEQEAPGSGGETFWAVRRLFEALARERPVVLVFEDLHWAEPTLLDLIEYFTEQASSAPILLLALARPELLETRTGWSSNATTRLAPLSGNESETLIENLGELPDELRTHILHAAGGNPLFLEQLLAHTNEGGEPESMPPSLELLLASRLDHLDPRELAALQRAAVAGREFSREAVAHLLPDEEPATLDAHLLAAIGKGLIDEGTAGREGSYRFHHVLIRDAAYATLPKAQRAELHERFARWLETRRVRSDELIGFHLEQAYQYLVELGPIGPEGRRLAADAGERLGSAGLRAAKAGDMPAAATLLMRACALLDARQVAGLDLLTELGLVFWRAGRLQAVEDALAKALDVATSVPDSRAELRVLVERAYLRLFREPEGGAEELLSLTAEAIPVLEELGDDRTLGRIWYILAHVHGGFHCRYRESAEAAERAMEYFIRSGWPLAPCLQELAVSLYIGPLPVGDGIRRCRALLEHADRGGEAHVQVFLAGLEAMGGRFDTARELVMRARTTYEELDWKDKIWANYAAIAAEIELLAGENGAAERLLAESCERLEAWGEQARLATQAAQLGDALYRQARFEEARRWADVAERCAASDDASAQFSWRALRAKTQAREGAFDTARALAREAVEIAEATDAVSQHAQVLLDSAEVFVLEGRNEAAAEAVANAIGLLDEKGNEAAGARARALLAELTSD
ncbi:MAG TPA: BTAD domain-containing putative transcriptional regulator [Gaiellaceae bacterium]|nr:BTAD domain-containing putative transcriptional regulator [Gaiellaceae bacterium]